MSRYATSLLAGLLCCFLGFITGCQAEDTTTASANNQVSQSQLEAAQSWQASTLDWQGAAVDLSFLNANEKPAGKRGFVKAHGEQLIFADGTQARFWGVNIAAYALFGTPKSTVQKQARRLAAMGFNLVRVHHIDSPWVNPNIFIDNANDTQQINAASMDKLDWWIKCLKDEGIYVWLDLHVQRALKKNDQITDFDEISQPKNSADLKGYNYVNASIERAMRRFNRAYLTHKNPYTGLDYTQEPAIVAALITNENDITSHYGNLLVPGKGAVKHSERYQALATLFAAQHHLDREQTWRAWQAGPAKVFLNDLEQRFNLAMITDLKALGFRAPIVTTNYWGDSPLSALPALTKGDIIDAHAYRPTAGLDKNPLKEDSLIDWLASAQVVNKPMSVSEWNTDPFPADDRQLLPLYMATQSSFQGWDALMLYAYAQSAITAPQDWQQPSNWDAVYDPSLMATMPAAALLYRRGDVKEASKTYVLDVGSALFNADISPKNAVFLRTAKELGKLQVAMPANQALPWLAQSPIGKNVTVFHDPNQSLIKQGQTSAVHADFVHNWQQGQLIINTPFSQGVVGTSQNTLEQLQDVTVQSQTAGAVVMVQSLTKAPIHAAHNLLLSLSAHALPTDGNRYPYRAEPVIGTLKIRAPAGLILYKNIASQPPQRLHVQYRDGVYTIPLDAQLNTNWLTLKN